MGSDDKRRYCIQGEAAYHYLAGVTRDEKQVLMGLCGPQLVALYFDAEGNLLGVDHRLLACFEGASPPYNIYDDRIAPLIDAWQKEMGFRPATIQVKKFFSPELSIGIEDYPSHFHEILADPEASDKEVADIRDSVKSWDKDGQFVLFWGNDFWLDGSGEVVSS